MQPGAPLPVNPGAILIGKYRVERIIGQGGMGVVVKAHHVALNERVALKFLLPEYAAHPEASARFIREAQAAVRIKSEHVARVSDVGTLEGGSPYMVMEYLEGADVLQELERAGPMAAPEATDYIIQACDAIAEAHAHGIVHRDIKPANLFVTRRMDGMPLVKVLDFGISKVMDADVSDSLTRTTATMGSALYMSPEQLQQARSVDLRTDIYAIGISLFEMLTGRQPFTADTFPQLCVAIATGTPTPLRSLRPDLPEAFAQVVEKAYARDRNQRYQSVAELVAALAPWAPPRSQPVVERIMRAGGIGSPQVITGDWSTSQSGAVGASTDLSAVRMQPQRGRPGLVIGLLLAAVAAVAVLGGGALLFLHSRSSSAAPEASSPAAEPAPGPSAPAPSAAPAPEAASASAAPTPSATEAPSEEASAPRHAAPARPEQRRTIAHSRAQPSHPVSAPKPPVHNNTGPQDNGAMR
jgi:eukaryotic-like serine/threonine-protein kinase